MAFEGLSDRLQDIFRKLRGKGKITEEDVKVAMREVRLALLEADVNFKVCLLYTSPDFPIEQILPIWQQDSSGNLDL